MQAEDFLPNSNRRKLEKIMKTAVLAGQKFVKSYKNYYWNKINRFFTENCDKNVEFFGEMS